MKREEKTAVVEDLAQKLGEAGAIFAVDYKGISVPQAAELRTKLRESDATFKVVKNRLAKRAAEQAGTDGLDELLTGPIALALINGDPVVVAKTITTFTKEHDVLEYRGGIMDGAPLDIESFKAIAKLPALEVLHGQLVGLTASPLTGLVAGLSNLISGLGRQLAQMAEQGLVTGEAPSTEAEPPSAGSDPTADATPEPAEQGSAEQGSDPSDAEQGSDPSDAEQGSDPSDAEQGSDPSDAGEEDPAEETSEAPEEEAAAEQDNQESSEESAPEGEDSEEPDSETTPEEE